VTVPLYVVGNRPYIDVALQRPDGSARSARFLVDTGGGGFIVTEPVARELGMRWEKTTREGGQAYGHVISPPKAFVGAMPVELDPGRVVVAIGTDRVLSSVAGGRPEGMFPGHLLARYHVVLNYPNRTFTLGRPGVLRPKGVGLPMPVFKESGFPRTEIEVDGVRYGLLLDTGASFTMVSEVLLHSWGSKHPEWPRHPGAFGEAVTLGGETLETMFIPGAQWGSNTLGEFGVTSQGKGVFENRMSQMMTSPIVGSLAGNVLKRFRVELDYANKKLYLSTP
jgi:predicted aspartyl protease